MIVLIIGNDGFYRFHQPLISLRYLSQALFMRSFFCCCAFSMKATNSREGLGILIVLVVFILIVFVPQNYDFSRFVANFYTVIFFLSFFINIITISPKTKFNLQNQQKTRSVKDINQTLTLLNCICITWRGRFFQEGFSRQPLSGRRGRLQSRPVCCTLRHRA